MAKVTLASEFEAISGRLCVRNSSVIAVNKKTGKMYRYDYHKPDQPNSEAQQQVKATFTQKAKAASAWWRANKPVDGQQPTAEYVRLKKVFDAQRKYGNIYAFVRSLVTNDLQVVIGGQSSVVPSPTPGGGTNEMS